jgi:threonine synthase
MLVLETALPAKFAATIQEALGREPERPAALQRHRSLPKRFTVMPADAAGRSSATSKATAPERWPTTARC